MRARLDKRIERARARHELVRLVMGTNFLVIKRASEASKPFSLVMKTHTCLRHTCMSSPRIDAHALQSRAQRAPPPLGYVHEKSCAYNPRSTTRKMVPVTGRARSFLYVFKNKIKRRGDRIKATGLSIYPML